MNDNKTYRVYNQKGEFIVQADAIACAKKLGITVKSFKQAARDYRRGRCKKYKIYDVSDEPEREYTKSEQELIDAWDNLVTPIRERFGIPVYRPRKEDVKE